jgi:hypothetical protein
MLHTFIVATAVFTSPPPLSFSPIPDRLAPFGTVFSKHIDVFGTHVFATRATPDAKVTHAAAVLAQWLDNNEDGVPDSPEVAAAMAGRDAYLFMTALGPPPMGSVSPRQRDQSRRRSVRRGHRRDPASGLHRRLGAGLARHLRPAARHRHLELLRCGPGRPVRRPTSQIPRHRLVHLRRQDVRV